jgi:LysM repeat protein
VDELEKQVQALQSARAQDRAAVVEELSRKMAAMMQNQTAARSAAAGSASAYGYEHVVKTGQTLSEIAQAYGVSVSAIKKANNLKSDMVRSGQKLFIPER